MLVNSIFILFPLRFLKTKKYHFSYNDIVLCKYFQFGQHEHFVVCKRVKPQILPVDATDNQQVTWHVYHYVSL